jgi:hypothetical protein
MSQSLQLILQFACPLSCRHVPQAIFYSSNREISSVISPDLSCPIRLPWLPTCWGDFCYNMSPPLSLSHQRSCPVWTRLPFCLKVIFSYSMLLWLNYVSWLSKALAVIAFACVCKYAVIVCWQGTCVFWLYSVGLSWPFKIFGLAAVMYVWGQSCAYVIFM